MAIKQSAPSGHRRRLAKSHLIFELSAQRTFQTVFLGHLNVIAFANVAYIHSCHSDRAQSNAMEGRTSIILIAAWAGLQVRIAITKPIHSANA